jgi:hypothetical protein
VLHTFFHESIEPAILGEELGIADQVFAEESSTT